MQDLDGTNTEIMPLIKITITMLQPKPLYIPMYVYMTNPDLTRQPMSKPQQASRLS